MNLSRKWLSEFVDVTVSSKEYDDAMTDSGSKVETTYEPSQEIQNVVVGKVLETERHPDSDHLWICQIDIGEAEPVQIVTGAQNVRVGDLVPVAKHKSLLPGGVKIEKGKLRGVKSNGMMCSIKELGLDLHDVPYAIEDGIWILEEPDAVPGADIRPIIGADDSIVEFEITNNRPDCLSVIGLARETAATFGRELKLHEPAVKGGSGDIHAHLSVEIANPELCPRYTAKMVKNIKIEPSPRWMRQRLRAMGVRPINNIVDITNYVMLEYGQPMHAFDYSCLDGGKIVVRTARDGEVMDTLDGTPRALTKDMLVIADACKPVGLAGVMGGANSEITEKTEFVVFESANFNGTSIRRTATKLGMRTDASGRFEKGLDIENTYGAVMRACELVELLGAGEVLDGCIDIYPNKWQQPVLKLEPERINALLGAKIPEDFMVQTLERLGFEMDGDQIKVPSWRGDVEGMADIAEEVGRFYSYNKIEPTLFAGAAQAGGLTERQQLERFAGVTLRGMGYSEILTYSFISPSAYDKLRIPADSPLRNGPVILNPLGEDTSVMRTSMLPSMLDTLGRNKSVKNEDVKLYEISKVYRNQAAGELPDERTIIALGAYGQTGFFELKGAVEALLKSLRVNGAEFTAQENNPSYHPGRCAEITVGGKPVGVLGQIHPKVAAAWGLGETYTAELDFADLLSVRAAEGVYVPLPKYPTVQRDLAVVCDETVTIAQLTGCIRKAGGALLKDVTLFDIYTGSHIPEGKKSTSFALKLRADDRTLTDADSDAVMAAVLAALKDELGAVIR